jgi:hypothetical protein
MIMKHALRPCRRKRPGGLNYHHHREEKLSGRLVKLLERRKHSWELF